MTSLRRCLAAAFALVACALASCGSPDGPVAVASVTVAPPDNTLAVGDTLRLVATAKDASDRVLSDRTVAWSSSNQLVATVSSKGIVTGVTPDALAITITATSEGVSGTALVRVRQRAVASVAVAPQAKTVAVGGTLQLVAIVRDSTNRQLTDRVVTWASSNTTVATVSATGVVTAVQADAQPATITATSETVTGSAAVTVITGIPLVPTTLVTGGSHSCALTGTGEAYCWGDNASGQLGDGFTGFPDSCRDVPCSQRPIAVTGGLRFSTLAAGGLHTCGLTASGAAYCWGWGGFGQLGNGLTVSTATPVAVTGGLQFKAIATSGEHTCGLTGTGEAYCWGWNYTGSLGDSTHTDSPSPVAVVGGLTFTAIAAGSNHTCALTSAGAAYCWGQAAYGELGIDSTPSNIPSPVAVSGGYTFAAIGAGGFASCALTGTGAAYCWGENIAGQLGIGPSSPDVCHGRPCSMHPVPVSGNLTFAALAVTGAYHKCGVTGAGTAYCWGRNSSGQLGDGSATGSSVPITVSGSLSFSALATGGTHTCGVSDTGAVYCWGGNASGELGNGSTTYSPTPVAVLTASAARDSVRYASIETGRYHTCARTPAGVAYCWGFGGFGQLGNGTLSDAFMPRVVSGGVIFDTLGVGGVNACGLTSTGAAYCWGADVVGELGTGAPGPQSCSSSQGSFPCSTAPLAVAGGLQFASLSVNWLVVCGLDANGAAYCWGDNSTGALGIGSDTATLSACFTNIKCSRTPLPVGGGLRFKELAVGVWHVCGLTTGGAAYCWGDNKYGQLGIGADPAPSLCSGAPCRRSPVLVTGGRSFTTLRARHGHTCGLATDGNWYCWGSNVFGELGNGRTGPETCQSVADTILCSRQPVTVAPGISVTTVFPGAGYSCGRTAAGSAYCWGANGNGELGDGTRTGSLTAVVVAGGHTFATVSPYYSHTCGLTAQNVAYCWGSNSQGELGNSAVSSSGSTVPVRVIGQGASTAAAYMVGGRGRPGSKPRPVLPSPLP